MTQSTSKPRCTKDTIGNQGLNDLYEAFKTTDDTGFKAKCRELIKSSSGSKQTKLKFLMQLEFSADKQKMLSITNNYILAGMGLGV